MLGTLALGNITCTTGASWAFDKCVFLGPIGGRVAVSIFLGLVALLMVNGYSIFVGRRWLRLSLPIAVGLVMARQLKIPEIV